MEANAVVQWNTPQQDTAVYVNGTQVQAQCFSEWMNSYTPYTFFSLTRNDLHHLFWEHGNQILNNLPQQWPQGEWLRDRQ